MIVRNGSQVSCANQHNSIVIYEEIVELKIKLKVILLLHLAYQIALPTRDETHRNELEGI